MSAPADRSPADLFASWRSGEHDALTSLLPLVYEELRRVAHRHLRLERADHTLQTTELIHEAYLRLIAHQPPNVQDRSHFVALTSHLMRQILVDHARQKSARKRDGGVRVELTDDLIAAQSRDLDVLEVDAALLKLAQLDFQQARIIELRYFGGLSIRETSEVLNVSTSTVKRDWDVARAWLYREIEHLDPI